MKILVWKDDDYLYVDLMRFLYEVDLLQGHASLNATLRRHPKIKKFLLEKQVDQIKEIEADYFMPDGSLNLEALDELNKKYPRVLD